VSERCTRHGPLLVVVPTTRVGPDPLSGKGFSDLM
jgi:hypothetical protein